MTRTHRGNDGNAALRDIADNPDTDDTNRGRIVAGGTLGIIGTLLVAAAAAVVVAATWV